MSNVEAVQNLIDTVQEALTDNGFELTEDSGYALTYAREDGTGTSHEYQLNWDEGTVTREQYNMNGTQLMSEVTRMNSPLMLNQILSHM